MLAPDWMRQGVATEWLRGMLQAVTVAEDDEVCAVYVLGKEMGQTS